eukprot:TRINITY_DN839_c0_g2_i1.p1 TRINITY_DN839_c0_g2~~TRINITY_DN839_c0_g2_i1.p1  ORF type:complete len:220 (-),score=55.56 TRINITY_DN839_c0_g2_i1:192-851(-)
MSNIIYKQLTSKYVSKAVECCVESLKTSPFTTTFKLQPKNWAAISGLFIERAAKQDLSIVAVDENDTVAGVIINEDFKDTPPDPYYHLGDEWKPLRALFNELHLKYKSFHPQSIGKGQILHPLYFSNVRPEYRQQGIMTNLREESLNVALTFNFELMIAEASNTVTSTVCERLGFNKVASIDYKTWLYQNKNILFDLPSLDKSFQEFSIYERHITSNLY